MLTYMDMICMFSCQWGFYDRWFSCYFETHLNTYLAEHQFLKDQSLYEHSLPFFFPARVGLAGGLVFQGLSWRYRATQYCDFLHIVLFFIVLVHLPPSSVFVGCENSASPIDHMSLGSGRLVLRVSVLYCGWFCLSGSFCHSLVLAVIWDNRVIWVSADTLSACPSIWFNHYCLEYSRVWVVFI